MDIQKKVKSAISKSLSKLGAVTITIDGQKVEAIPSETDSDRNLIGGSREMRDADYQFTTIKGLRIRKGMRVKADGLKWKIDNYRKGKAMTTISLIEPNRVEE